MSGAIVIRLVAVLKAGVCGDGALQCISVWVGVVKQCFREARSNVESKLRRRESGSTSLLRQRDAATSPNYRSDVQPARGVFWAWTAICGVVGAQMGWILRPFIGSPDLPVEVFRQHQSNFFEAFFEALGQLLRGS